MKIYERKCDLCGAKGNRDDGNWYSNDSNDSEYNPFCDAKIDSSKIMESGVFTFLGWRYYPPRIEDLCKGCYTKIEQIINRCLDKIEREVTKSLQ